MWFGFQYQSYGTIVSVPRRQIPSISWTRIAFAIWAPLNPFSSKWLLILTWRPFNPRAGAIPSTRCCCGIYPLIGYRAELQVGFHKIDCSAPIFLDSVLSEALWRYEYCYVLVTSTTGPLLIFHLEPAEFVLDLREGWHTNKYYSK